MQSEFERRVEGFLQRAADHQASRDFLAAGGWVVDGDEDEAFLVAEHKLASTTWCVCWASCDVVAGVLTRVYLVEVRGRG